MTQRAPSKEPQAAQAVHISERARVERPISNKHGSESESIK